MTIKRFISFALGMFVVVAVVTLVMQANPAEDSPAAPVPVAAVTAPVTPAPEAASIVAVVPPTEEVPSATPEQPAEPEPVPAPREKPAPEPVKLSPAPATPPEPPPVLTEPKESEYRVVVTYFHGNVRCVTCRRIETYAQEAVEYGFPEDLHRGTVVFQSINVERPENRHYIQDYRLVTRTVIVALEQEGAVREWVNLQGVWNYVSNRQVYFNYVQGAVSDFLSMRPS